MSKKYLEKLRDPRWQKVRLLILERDGWSCQICESKENTLHVHHTYYECGKDPWEYPARSLITLCEYCHEEERDLRKHEEGLLLKTLGLYGFLSSDINEISMALYEKNLDYLCRFLKERLNV